jgi:NAD(P)-dependent dehydrogenase (short-subunit alcohol dehydrogenase family)
VCLPANHAKTQSDTHSRASSAAYSATDGGREEQGAYAASKAGIQCLTETLALEGKPDDIYVFCVVPRRTATELRKKLFPDEVRIHVFWRNVQSHGQTLLR